MFYMIVSIRTPDNSRPTELPELEGVSLKEFDRFNPKVFLYTLEAETLEAVELEFNKLQESPKLLVTLIDTGEILFSISDSNVWIWKQVIRNVLEQGYKYYMI